MPVQEPDQQLSDEQNYRETIRGVRSFMGWHQVPEFGSSASSQDDNPFAAPENSQLAKSLSSYLQMSDCVERNSTSLSLRTTLPVVLKTFVVLNTEKWYDMYAEKKDFSWSKVPCWTDGQAKSNSFFPRQSLSISTDFPTYNPEYTDKMGEVSQTPVSLPLTQLFVQEPAGQRGSR